MLGNRWTCKIKCYYIHDSCISQKRFKKIKDVALQRLVAAVSSERPSLSVTQIRSGGVR